MCIYILYQMSSRVPFHSIFNALLVVVSASIFFFNRLLTDS